MATGERRLGSSSRRGMTVLGKIPVVPRPINLPSQRLENRGLDPSVEIVPRGTFSWGTGRSPPANTSSWGNVGLSSSPPTNTGAWNTASLNAKPISSTDSVSGGVAQNPPRPLSAGSTRPLSAGSTRPSSASATSGRAWAGAPKLDEQIQPSHFSLATVDFPTLGSEKNPNLRPQQNTAPSNRPTSADATKERISAHAGTSLNRPTSADGSKERKMVSPGVATADRPMSADGSFVDKGRHQSDTRFLPLFVDGNPADQRHPLYSGVFEHGAVGPGPGNHAQFKDNRNLYPPVLQHSTALPGSHMLHVGNFMQPGSLQHERHFNGPLPLHRNIERDVLVLPVDTRPGVYNIHHMDLGPNHFDRSMIHHPQSSWGPNHHLDRSGVYQNYHPPGILQIEPHPYGREAAMQHRQGNRRDGSNAPNKHIGEQRAASDGRNLVLIGSSTDPHEPFVPIPGSGREPQNPDLFISSWGQESKHSGWDNTQRGDTSMGTGRVGPLSAAVEQTELLPAEPEDRQREDEGAGHTGETVHSVPSREYDAGKFGANNSVLQSDAFPAGIASDFSSKGVAKISSPLRPTVQFHKQEDSVKNLKADTMHSGFEVLKKRNDTWVNGSPSGSSAGAGMQLLKMKPEVERNRAEPSNEPQRVGFVSNAKPRQEVNWHGNLQSKNNSHFADTYSPNRQGEVLKDINAKKETLISQRSTKGNRKDDSFPSPPPTSDEPHRAIKMYSSKSSEVNGRTSSSAALSASSGKQHKSDTSSGVHVSSGATKEASADAGSNASLGAVQARSPPNIWPKDASVGDHKAMPTAESNFVAPVVEIPALEEEGQALIDESNVKARQSTHLSRRPQHGRSVHESHLGDKQHVNQSMVWAPVKTPTAGAPNQANVVDQEPTQYTTTEIHHEKPMQPLQKHQPSDSRGQRHIQQLQETQPAASSKPSQGQQGQGHIVTSTKRQVQQGRHQKVETNQQGQMMQLQQSRTSNHNESEKWMQQEQSTAKSYKNQMLEIKQSKASTHQEQEQSQSQFAASSQREVNMTKSLPAKEQQENAAESRLNPITDKVNNKKNKSENAIYVPRPARNQQHQGWEQEHGQSFVASSQRFHNKDESSVVEDQEIQPSESSTIIVADSSEPSTTPVANSIKGNEEVKSRNSRFSKHQKRHQHDPPASLSAGERHASTWKKPLPAETGVNSGARSSVAELEVNEENKSGPQKAVRHQEMQNKQSAVGSHQEYIHVAREHKKTPMETSDSNICEPSTNKNEMKLYVPKHRKEKANQHVSTTTDYEGQKGQECTLEEVSLLPNEKGQHYAQSPQLSGVGSSARKDGLELYTPKPARHSIMHGQQATAHSNRRQKVADLVEGQSVRASSSQATIACPLNKDKEMVSHEGVQDLMENNDSWQSIGAGNRGDNRMHGPYEPSQGKKEVKHYVARPARQQQQPVLNVDPVHAETPNREERPFSERAHQMPGTESSKRKEEMKRYTPKPARQPTPAVSPTVLDVKSVKEIEEVALLKDQKQQRSESEGRANEFEHSYKNKNHPSRLRKSAHAFLRPQMKSQPPLEDGAANDHTARCDETDEAVTHKEAIKDRESGFNQKRGSRPRNRDVAENLKLEETEIVRPKQYLKQPQYLYQPVTQHPQTGKPCEEESVAVYDQKFNNRQQDHGHSRHREGLSRRGRPHGYNYRVAEHAG